jgi:predicted aldo/keto reductase-like oxidoreductase
MAKSLPFGDIQVPIPGFGAMGLSSAMGSNLDLEQAEPVLQKAIELGCTFWDTAVSRTKNWTSRRNWILTECSDLGCLPKWCQ